jgi:hypothetical protein
LEGFLADCILDTIFLERVKVDLSHRFDFTIQDLFGIINEQRSERAIELTEFYKFLLMIGTTAPIQKPDGYSGYKHFMNQLQFPNPPVTPNTCGYLISRMMFPVEMHPDDCFLSYERFEHFLLPFSHEDRKQLLSRLPKDHLMISNLTKETREKLKQLFEETIKSEMNMDFWRQEIKNLGVTREELAAWFGNGAHSLGIL